MAKYITKVNSISNLVSVIEESGGREYHKKEQIYRKHLTSIYEKEADKYQEIEQKTKRGKELKLMLRNS